MSFDPFGLPEPPDDLLEPPDVNAPRSTVASRRRAWVREALTQGRTHPEIAQALGISYERVRQIAKESLAGHSVEPVREHIHVQIARLTPALGIASDAVARGEVSAVPHLIKILDRLDAYQARALTLDIPSEDPERAEAKRKFMANMERIKEDFREMGFAEQVDSLAAAYAATEVLAEHQAEKAAKASPPTPSETGENHKDIMENTSKNQNTNWNDGTY